MKIPYQINEEDNTILLGETPKQDMVNGLKIVYGEDIPRDTGIVNTPAIMTDVKAGKNVYELPPVGAVEGFNKESIKEVLLEDKCLDIITRRG